MPTGFDLLEHSSTLRRHWLRRLAATLVDVAIIFIPMRLLIFFVNAPYQDLVSGLLSGAMWFVYSGALEGAFGRTLGKWFFNLRVVSLSEKRSMHQFLTRNVPKFFWYIFLPFDVIVGLVMDGDPRQRWSDTVANTNVVSFESESAQIKRRGQPTRNLKKSEADSAKL